MFLYYCIITLHKEYGKGGIMKQVEVIKAKATIVDRSKGVGLSEKLRVAPYCRVSTDDEEQLDSYRSQVLYYTDMVKSNPSWHLVDIYADKAITGTQVDKREDFQRMIQDCVAGKIDMIITKSISRFARNTLDTLKYVRMLKERNIAVKFEEENINTLTMDGELMLTILSSVAQQEVQNISANVKKGLKMKMQRGELIGFQGCLGYDYDKETKTIHINHEEAKIVKYIFKRYIEGAGGHIIAKELRQMGHKSKRGLLSWPESTITGIISNEKYKGDILMGKTFTVDPISKRRLENMGESDKFYLSEHHEPIISVEDWEMAQEILKRRSRPRLAPDGAKREPFTRKYSFSCMIKCGFCGETLSRRSWHSGTPHQKSVWQCVTATKGGRKFCPDSKGVDEKLIERAFVESYQRLMQDNESILNDFLAKVTAELSDDSVVKEIEKVNREIRDVLARKDKLLDLRLDESITKDEYDLKNLDFCAKIEELKLQLEELQQADTSRKSIEKRIAEFKKVLLENKGLTKFDRAVFESIVEKVIVGGFDENGAKDPQKISFVYKTGFKDDLNGRKFRSPRKVRVDKKTGIKGISSSSKSSEFEKLCYSDEDNTR